MCGLIGMMGDLTFEARGKVFRDLLDVCQTRGRDSTGVIKIDKALEYDWLKQVGTPSVLCDSRQYEQRIDRGDAVALIGHCRAKTVGDVSVKNAHPFDYPEEGICGVHNGTLQQYHTLDTHAYGKVDSEILYGHLAKNGVDETFPVIKGAYACVWWDNNEKTVNFIRNDQRPLWFTWSEDRKMMFWASEPWFFGAVSRRIKLWDGGEDKTPYIELPVHTLWSFKSNPHAKGDTPTVVMAPAREVKPKPRPIQTYQYHHHNRDEWGQNWKRTGNGTYERRTAEASQENKNGSSVNASNKSGGEVANPFLLNRDKLGDPLPDGLAPTEKENSPLCNVTFLKRSTSSSDSSTARTPSMSSSRNILSLPDKSSRNSPTKNNDGPCGNSEASYGNTTIQMPRGVSLRTVVGVRYITDNATKAEWSSAQFFTNTKGECSFCLDKIMNLDEVAIIVNPNSFICKECIEEPKETKKLIAG